MDSLFDDSRKDELLYHYTSVEKAVSILCTRSLLFSQISGLNDLNESQRTIFCTSLADNDLEKCFKALNAYRQISFSWDSNYPYRGFDLASMWGYYADKGKGVCLVFNKASIIRTCETLPNCHFGGVMYDNDYDNAVIFKSSSPESELKRSIKEVFFTKSQQWIHEQEYRLIIPSKGGVDCLSINDSIEAIIFASLDGGPRDCPCETKGYWALNKTHGSIPLFGYNHRDLNGCRSIYKDSDGQEVWSSGDIINLGKDGWTIDI